MKLEKKTLVVPALLITVGSGWLLSALGIVPDIDWVWTLALAMIGSLTLALGGLNKVSVVLGPFFLLASGCSVLRQTGHLRLNVEVPSLVIFVGILMLVARLPIFSMPSWMLDDSTSLKRSAHG